MKKSRDTSKHKHGWVYMDLVQRDGTRLHLQLYLHLTPTGIQEALLGHLDLSSSLEAPMPSGTVGKVTFAQDSSTVQYVLTQDLQTTANIETTMPISAGHLLGKALEVNTFVAAPFSSISVMVQYVSYHPSVIALAVTSFLPIGIRVDITTVVQSALVTELGPSSLQSLTSMGRRNTMQDCGACTTRSPSLAAPLGSTP